MTCFIFSSFKTLLTCRRIISTGFNVLNPFLLAGFQVTAIGRFWVTAEAFCQQTEWKKGSTKKSSIYVHDANWYCWHLRSVIGTASLERSCS